MAKNSEKTRCCRASARASVDSGKWICCNAILARSGAVIPRQQCLHLVVGKIFQGVKNQPAKDTLRKTFCRRIDRRDSAEMNRLLLVALDHFELRMLHADALAAQPRLSEDDQTLAGRDHLLHVMEIEPAKHQRLAERIRIRSPARSPRKSFSIRQNAARDVFVTSPQMQIGVSLSSRGKPANSRRSSWRRGKCVSKSSTVAIPSRRKGASRARGTHSHCSSSCDISITQSELAARRPARAPANASHPRIHPIESGKRRPMAARAGSHWRHRRRSRAHDSSFAADEGSGVCPSGPAARRPAPLRGQKMSAARCRSQTAPISSCQWRRSEFSCDKASS